jgi:hypothetical protein
VSRPFPRELALYRESMGDEKADRQAELAKALRPCCGTARDRPHHPYCPKRWRW